MRLILNIFQIITGGFSAYIQRIFTANIHPLQYLPIYMHTVRKAKHDVGPKHFGDGKFRPPHRLSGGFLLSFYVDDGIFPHLHVLVLRHARLFNSVHMNPWIMSWYFWGKNLNSEEALQDLNLLFNVNI
jgi:hypothetical protein